ncbi:MAG: LamG domain-containing protein, partial [Candidatus Omnitrophica bacterium]|nr:LamG domain-containing protein [Candidatus Omnitrophota bacterium]
MNDLNSSDVVDLVITDESSSTGTAPTLTADQMGITGVYIDSMFVNVSGATDLANGTTIGIAVNGTLQSEFGVVVAGSFNIDVGKPVNSGDIITVWGSLVTDGNEATSVTKYDGTGDITGLDLTTHVLRIGSDDNATLTLSDLGLYDYTDSEDVMHQFRSGILLLVDAGGDYADDELEIVTGNALTVSSTERIEGHDADLNGTVTVSGTLIFSGSWDATGGTFNGTGSTVMFTSTAAETITSANEIFDDLIINDGLLGYWKLDESASPARDSSGYDNHGTWVANTTGTMSTNGTFIHFENPGSVELDGTGDYINTGRATEINNLTNGFTVAMWIYPDVTTGTQRLVAASRENTNNGFAFGLQGSNLRFSTFG